MRVLYIKEYTLPTRHQEESKNCGENIEGIVEERVQGVTEVAGQERERTADVDTA